MRILFVCLGNICRSPAAHAVLEKLLKDSRCQQAVTVDSAGLLDYHEGELPDKRMQRVAQKRGYELSHRARQIRAKDFQDFDLIIAMDREVLESVQRLAASSKLDASRAKISLFLDFWEDKKGQDVPDPYWSGEEGFDHVLDLIEGGCRAILNKLVNNHS